MDRQTNNTDNNTYNAHVIRIVAMFLKQVIYDRLLFQLAIAIALYYTK